MDFSLDDVQVVHNEAQNRFEATINGQLSVLDYALEDGRILYTHTGVPAAQRGRGVAAKLAQAALEYARENNLAVVPLCSYVASYIRRHPEYKPLVQSRS